jgi:EAL domain-containing protein (putative c-di-GMP-specific phosphodiesterase class I)/CheY-like chemotaxis protein
MSKVRLLVIDDETDICDLITDVAETRGFEVKTVSEPNAVEAALREFTPQAIMLDLMMPGTDGVELLRNLSSHIRGCAIVLMSGHDARVLNSASRLGTAHGLNIVGTQEKPIDIAALRLMLDKLASAGVRQEKRRTDVDGSTVKQEEIALYYQPIIEFETGKVRGLEALARWNHPTYGIITPDLFLEKLDAPNLDRLAAQVMFLATRDLAEVHSKGFPIAVSINMTAGNLIDLAVPDRLDELCREHKLPPEKVNVEVTENEVMREVRRIIDVLTRLRLRGFGVAIDDFGIGYSSLRELQRMPISVMKMDKSFVLDMAENRDSKMIAHTIIELGHNLGFKVVAEGVESLHVANLLKERRCDLMQGYLVSKPLPLDRLLIWLQENGGVYKF